MLSLISTLGFHSIVYCPSYTRKIQDGILFWPAVVRESQEVLFALFLHVSDLSIMGENGKSSHNLNA